MISSAILCLGGNTTDCKMRLESACKRLAVKADIKRCSEIIISDDITGRGEQYVNQSIEIATALTLEELRLFIHEIEQSEGRTPESKSTGQMPIDIDIVMWNEKIISPTNYSRSYFQQSLTSLK